MDTTITVASTGSTLFIPIHFIFWAYVAAYVVHILDESLLGENFVEMVKRNFWPAYSWKHFFGFNTLLMSLIILSIVLFELLGVAWVVLPLTFVFVLSTNGLWHLGATLITRRYSPGLLTSVLYWMLFYFVFRYAFLRGEISVPQFVIAGIVGTLITILMIGSFFVLRRRFGATTQTVKRP